MDLHCQRYRAVIAEQHKHFSDAGAAKLRLNGGELGVRQLGAAYQRVGEGVDGSLMRIG